jgi:hypothetical protein
MRSWGNSIYKMGILFRFIITIVFIGSADNIALGQNSSNYFKKIEISKDKYKLIPASDSISRNIIIYPPVVSNLSTFEDSLFLLKSLLGFQGDTSYCSVKPMNYPCSNPNQTSYKVPDSSNYEFITIEIEALFIFNFIIEPKQFYLASFPRLQKGRFGVPALDQMFSLHDQRLSIVYDYYRKWLEKCENARTFNIGYYPLDYSKYSWL